MKHFEHVQNQYVIRDGAGKDLDGGDLSGMTVYVEDYAENQQMGIPAIMGLVQRVIALASDNPGYVLQHRGFDSNIAVYVHDEAGFGHVVYLAELIDAATGECAYDQEGW